ncbi:MAG: GreA/GreB family elongation factor [Oscillospiraceae bacterium]|nr:GreA/GreB family elongation factor [Oscillospiraceae bacterium]
MHDYLTQKDIELMKAELYDLETNKRPAVIAEVQRTRAFGDLSENYEYKAAKEEQRAIDSRMRHLNNMIRTAKIIDQAPKKGHPNGVRLYDKVTIYIPEDEEEMVIRVVSTVRVAPDQGFISLESPLGKAVLGKEVGSVVTVKVNDSYSYDVEIRSIEQSEDDGSAPLMKY